MRIRLSILAALLAPFSSCSSGPRFVKYDFGIDKSDDLIVSYVSYLTNQDAPNRIKRTGSHQITTSFDFSAKNVGSVPVSFHGDQAAMAFEQGTQPETCAKVSDQSASFQIAPGTTVRVECKVVVNSDDQNRLAMKDSVTTLEVPYSSLDESRKIQAKFYFHREDFK